APRQDGDGRPVLGWSALDLEEQAVSRARGRRGERLDPARAPVALRVPASGDRSLAGVARRQRRERWPGWGRFLDRGAAREGEADEPGSPGRREAAAREEEGGQREEEGARAGRRPGAVAGREAEDGSRTQGSRQPDERSREPGRARRRADPARVLDRLDVQRP